MGNTKTYDGNTFYWTTHQLDKITGNGKTNTYKYNANGIRTEKTVNGVTTKYYIEGDRIVLEKVGNEDRAFWYDGDGKAAAFVIYDSTGMHPYYYIRNGQGDVIGLFDASGNVVARYSYDSWGNLLSIKDGSGNDKTNDTTFFGYKNPIRYRGYYYDSETKLYYLQSRYYNPEWERFINADGIITSNLVGSNLFTYCYNNPVNLVDPHGTCPYASPASMPYSSWEQHQKYCGWCINYASKSLPIRGKPNSKEQLYGDDGELKQERKMGDNGDAARDRDYDHEDHEAPFPHDHQWTWENGVPHRGPAEAPSPDFFQVLGGIALIGVAAIATIWVVANDATGVGVADDASLPVWGGLFAKGLGMLFG